MIRYELFVSPLHVNVNYIYIMGIFKMTSKRTLYIPARERRPL